MSTDKLCPNVKSAPVVVAGSRMPSQLVTKCKTRNSNNRRSECEAKADALHGTYAKRIERADKQRNDRRAKRQARQANR